MQQEVPIDEKTQFIDLRSDTVSRAPKQMLKFMSQAEVGDDVFEDDPLVNKFQSMVAKMFGKQAGLFFPSTTMGNVVSIMGWTKPGDQMIVWANTHLIDRESSSASLIAGVQTRQIFAPSGIFTVNDVKQKYRSEKDHIVFPNCSLIFLQNPAFSGKNFPLESLKEIYGVAKEKNIKLHMDAARIFNAYHAYNKIKKTSYEEIGSYCDSMTICMNKGMCCPVGSLLLGPKQMINRSRKLRKSLGGGMRQVGLFAASGLYSLEHIVPNIKKDNQMALMFGKMLKQMKQIEIDMDQVEINMVHFRIVKQGVNHDAFKKNMDINKIRIKPVNKDTQQYRFVCYRQIRQAEVNKVMNVIKQFFLNN